MSQQIVIDLKTQNPVEVQMAKAKLQTIANFASQETLTKIAELIQKPGANEKFISALNNSLVKRLF